jgi:hypothetical protein
MQSRNYHEQRIVKRYIALQIKSKTRQSNTALFQIEYHTI